VKEKRDSEPCKVRVDAREKIDEGVDDEMEEVEEVEEVKEGAVLSDCTKTRRQESSLR